MWKRDSGRYGKSMVLSCAVCLFSLAAMISVAVTETPDENIALPKRKPEGSVSLCGIIRIADTGSEEVVAMNAVFSYLVKQLGYKPQTVLLKPEFVDYRMEQHGTDVFLAHWSNDAQTIKAKQHIHIFESPSLHQAAYGLAVPDYLFHKGLHSAVDLPRFKIAIGSTIFSLEESEFHQQVLKILVENVESFKDFHIKPITRDATETFLTDMTEERLPFVLLSWQPNRQNPQFRLRFLSQDPIALSGTHQRQIPFPPYNLYKIAKKSYLQHCPDVARILENIFFQPEALEQLMFEMISEGKPIEQAVIAWLQTKPRFLAKTLRDVKSLDQRYAFDIVLSSLAAANASAASSP